MIKVSELLSKRLISLNSAEIVGTISNIVFDTKLTSGKTLKIYNDNEDEATIKYVDLKKVKNLEFDACVISDKSYVTNEWSTALSGIVNPINCECFNQDGKSLGIVRDIILDKLSVKSILVDKKEFSPANLLSYSNQLLIFNDTGKPIKLAKTKPDFPPVPKTDRIVKIHTQKTFEKDNINQGDAAIQIPVVKENIKVKQAAAAEKAILPENITTPTKVPPSGTVISNPSSSEEQPSPYKFLIGKQLLRDIKNEHGEIIIKEKTNINQDTINLARKLGKLVQLALHAE